jgi:hypothetical protein
MGPTSHFMATSDWANIGPIPSSWRLAQDQWKRDSCRRQTGWSWLSSRCFCHAIMTAIGPMGGRTGANHRQPIGPSGPAGGTRRLRYHGVAAKQLSPIGPGLGGVVLDAVNVAGLVLAKLCDQRRPQTPDFVSVVEGCLHHD